MSFAPLRKRGTDDDDDVKRASGKGQKNRATNSKCCLPKPAQPPSDYASFSARAPVLRGHIMAPAALCSPRGRDVNCTRPNNAAAAAACLFNGKSSLFEGRSIDPHACVLQRERRNEKSLNRSTHTEKEPPATTSELIRDLCREQREESRQTVP